MSTMRGPRCGSEKILLTIGLVCYHVLGASAQNGSSSGGLSGGTVAGVAVGCLLAGVGIGVLVDMFLIQRVRERRTAGPSMGRKSATDDQLAERIVTNPYESSAERVTFNNPAFHRDSMSDPSDVESGSNRSSPGDSKASSTLGKMTRQPSVQWPQWTSSGSQGAIKKQWRESVASKKSEIGDVEAGVTDAVADLPKTGWFSALVKRLPKFKVSIPDSPVQEVDALAAKVDEEGVLPVTDMSAILDEVDQLAREIDSMPSSFPSQKPSALTEQAFGQVASAVPGSDAMDSAIAALVDEAPPQLPPTPDMSKLDERVEIPKIAKRPKLTAGISSSKLTTSSSSMGSAGAAAAAETKIIPSETLSAASSAMPKFEHKPLDSKSTAKLMGNPFLASDKRKSPSNTDGKMPEMKKRSSGTAHLADKFKQEEAAFKRPSLRSVASTKSSGSDSGKSGEHSIPGSASLGSELSQAAGPGFTKVSLRKVDRGKSPPSVADASTASNSLQQAMSGLKKTTPELPPDRPTPESKPPVPERLPEPLPTESEVDLMEATDDMYCDPDPTTPIPRSASFPATPTSMQPASVDLAAVTASQDEYILPEEASPAQPYMQEDYIEMAEGVPSPAEQNLPSTRQLPKPNGKTPGYMQLADAVTGDNNEYLDMTGTLPKAPQVAKRKISDARSPMAQPGSAILQKGAKQAKKAKEAKTGGFFSRLFKSKAKAPAPANAATPAQQAALSKLRPGWRVASTSSSVKHADLPVPAPPEWVQQLHQKGRQAYDGNDIYEEYGGDADGDMYEELNTSPRQHTVDKIAKPSEGRMLITAQAKEQAIADLQATPMPKGNVKRLTSHWVKKQV
ncbi:nascent polypeptide-associated complex subunit alpha, muscle-specific form-like [Sycon ciliatum]|uniref:nascent polypeptide-associated complex subunit alpha, muscle-specific form-like n=1 Tax=Sycon ciliatum TaxID=27933 RepID=UPI0031F640E7